MQIGKSGDGVTHIVPVYESVVLNHLTFFS